MAFVEIENAESIYDVLSTDPAFSGLVGSFSFDSGPSEALLVATASTPLEGLDSASGLVAVVEKDPTFTSTRLLTSQVVVDRMFTIRLLQFPTSAPRNMRAAIERLLEIFPGGSAIPLAGPDLLAADGQAVFKLPSNPVAHT